MYGSVHPRFQLDCLQIWCAGRLEQRHAIEVAELITLATTYYCYRRVVLRFCTGRASRGAVRLLREAIAEHRSDGLTLELSGNAALCRHLDAERPLIAPASRQIGFSADVHRCAATSSPMRHAKRS